MHDKGAPLNNCWGFIDGTVRPICRPGENQRTLYNGHKKVHALKYQSVVAANGLIANLFDSPCNISMTSYGSRDHKFENMRL